MQYSPTWAHITVQPQDGTLSKHVVGHKGTWDRQSCPVQGTRRRNTTYAGRRVPWGGGWGERRVQLQTAEFVGFLGMSLKNQMNKDATWPWGSLPGPQNASDHLGHTLVVFQHTCCEVSIYMCDCFKQPTPSPRLPAQILAERHRVHEESCHPQSEIVQSG